jgi:hypothetical protein
MKMQFLFEDPCDSKLFRGFQSDLVQAVKFIRSGSLILPQEAAMKPTAIVIILSLVLPSFAFPIQSPSPPSGWERLKSITHGQNLLVKMRGGKKINGKLENVSESNLELSVKGNPSTLGSADVLRVYRLKGRPVVKATLLGAVIGAGSGAAMGAIAGQNDTWFGPGLRAAAGGAVGLAIGTVTGFAIGASSRNKELVYEAPEAKSRTR